MLRMFLQVQKKPATAETESNSTEMPSDHEKVTLIAVITPSLTTLSIFLQNLK